MPNDFQGQKSKVKVTIDKYGNNLVNTIECNLLKLITHIAQDDWSRSHSTKTEKHLVNTIEINKKMNLIG